MTDARRERLNYIALEHGRRNTLDERFLFLTWGILSIRVSAEERSCLEGVYTMRMSRDESQKKL